MPVETNQVATQGAGLHHAHSSPLDQTLLKPGIKDIIKTLVY